MVEERAALLKSGARAIKPREAEELKREALEKGIAGKGGFHKKGRYRTPETPRRCLWKLHVGAAGHGHLCGRH